MTSSILGCFRHFPTWWHKQDCRSERDCRPSWAFSKIERQLNEKRQQGNTKKKMKTDKEPKSNGLDVIPYVKGLSESVSRVFRKHHVATAMWPHPTLRNILAQSLGHDSKNTKKTAIRTWKKFTKAEKKQSLTEYNKSAITDHVNYTNHVIDWEGSIILDREGDIRTRQIREAIHIRITVSLGSAIPFSQPRRKVAERPKYWRCHQSRLASEEDNSMLSKP